MNVTANNKYVVVRVTDKNNCLDDSFIYLTNDAFAVIATNPLQAQVSAKYEYVDCPFTGNIVYHVQDVAVSRTSVIVDNHTVGLAMVEIKDKTEWKPMKRSSSNVWEYGGLTVFSPLSFRVTSIDGEVITDNKICSLFQYIVT